MINLAEWLPMLPDAGGPCTFRALTSDATDLERFLNRPGESGDFGAP